MAQPKTVLAAVKKAAYAKASESGQRNAVQVALALNGHFALPKLQTFTDERRTVRAYIWEGAPTGGDLLLITGPSITPTVRNAGADEYVEASHVGVFVPSHDATAKVVKQAKAAMQRAMDRTTKGRIVGKAPKRDKKRAKPAPRGPAEAKKLGYADRDPWMGVPSPVRPLGGQQQPLPTRRRPGSQTGQWVPPGAGPYDLDTQGLAALAKPPALDLVSLLHIDSAQGIGWKVAASSAHHLIVTSPTGAEFNVSQKMDYRGKYTDVWLLSVIESGRMRTPKPLGEFSSAGAAINDLNTRINGDPATTRGAPLLESANPKYVAKQGEWFKTTKGDDKGTHYWRWDGMVLGEVLDTKANYGNNSTYRYRTSDDELHTHLRSAKLWEIESGAIPQLQRDGYLPKPKVIGPTEAADPDHFEADWRASKANAAELVKEYDRVLDDVLGGIKDLEEGERPSTNIPEGLDRLAEIAQHDDIVMHTGSTFQGWKRYERAQQEYEQVNSRLAATSAADAEIRENMRGYISDAEKMSGEDWPDYSDAALADEVRRTTSILDGIPAQSSKTADPEVHRLAETADRLNRRLRTMVNREITARDTASEWAGDKSRKDVDRGRPAPGKQYRLTGGSKSIAGGASWADSEMPAPAPAPSADNDDAMMAKFAALLDKAMAGS